MFDDESAFLVLCKDHLSSLTDALKLKEKQDKNIALGHLFLQRNS